MSLFTSKASMLLLSTAAVCHVYNGEDAGVASLKLKVLANDIDDEFSLLPEELEHDVELQHGLAASLREADAELERLLLVQQENEQLAMAMSLSAELSGADQLSEEAQLATIIEESLRAEEQRAETIAKQEALQLSEAMKAINVLDADGNFSQMKQTYISDRVGRARTANANAAAARIAAARERVTGVQGSKPQ